MYKLVCTDEFGCVRHPPDCMGFRDTTEPCNIRLRTHRENETKTLNVKIIQRFKMNNSVTTNDTILPKPDTRDMMFFILGKKSAKEKKMFMCHLGLKKVYILCCLL